MAPEGEGDRWEFRAEGCACAAFTSAKAHPGKVLLVSKKTEVVEGRGELSDREAQAARQLDGDIWTRREYPKRFSGDFSRIERREWFTSQVAGPLLSGTGVLALGDLVDLRSIGFTREAFLPPGGDGGCLGLFLPDALDVGRSLARSPHRVGPTETISFEFKPKSANMPGEKTLIHPRDGYKRSYSEHKLMQHYKLHKGKVETMSEYEPRDFWGPRDGACGEAEARRSKERALKALFQCPQNNLSVFRNSAKVFPGRCSRETLGKELGFTMDEIVAALAEALLQQQSTLDLIVSLQEKDVYGIQGVHRLYNGLLGKADAFDASGHEEYGEYVERVKDLQGMPRALALEALEDYLTAATFKDCSLIITLARSSRETADLRQRLCDLPNAGTISGVTKGEVLYHMQLIDMDLKHVSKIRTHYEKDKLIASIMEQAKA